MILGISPAIVRLHYAKWSPARQERIDQVILRVHAEAFGAEPEPPQERVN